MKVKTKTYYLKTFGCQANVADSERITTAIKEKGYETAKTITTADLVIINSCLVRESAENRVYGLVNNLSKLNKKIIITGCLAGWALKDKTGKNLNVLLKKTKNKAQVVLTKDIADFAFEPSFLDKNMAWVPISNGCNNFCSYCIVPLARGKEVSRPEKEIIKEIENRVKNGFSKITLLGQNVNSYGADLRIKDSKKITLVKNMGKKRIPTLFPHLLDSVAKLAGARFVDFMSSNPWDFSNELIRVILKNKNITRTIHLPLQSGDDIILKKMNRNYTAKDYLKLIEKIKKKIPQISFTTDIIVGFPGETKKQFENTIKICKKVGFKKAYINKYSPRPGTPATKLENNISPNEKKRRWLVLEKLINNY
jgi:tRNA-2-methylthio-N6-dimethylallyladenosine synthase